MRLGQDLLLLGEFLAEAAYEEQNYVSSSLPLCASKPTAEEAAWLSRGW